MELQLDDELSLEKVELDNRTHYNVLSQLNKENPQNTSFIWDFRKDIIKRNNDYLSSSFFYNSPYILHVEKRPIGFIDVSKIILPDKYVELVCALLLREQKKGYASRTILKLTSLLLNQYKEDINKVIASIESENASSIRLIQNAGYQTFDTEKQAQQNGIYIFEKKR